MSRSRHGRSAGSVGCGHGRAGARPPGEAYPHDRVARESVPRIVRADSRSRTSPGTLRYMESESDRGRAGSCGTGREEMVPPPDRPGGPVRFAFERPYPSGALGAAAYRRVVSRRRELADEGAVEAMHPREGLPAGPPRGAAEGDPTRGLRGAVSRVGRHLRAEDDPLSPRPSGDQAPPDPKHPRVPCLRVSSAVAEAARR